jgi:hypothetical protein
MTRHTNLREEMPTVTAWIDDLRAAFGADGINAQIKKGMAGLPGFFHARENGHGMAFDVPKAMAVSDTDEARPAESPDTAEPPESIGGAETSPAEAKAPAAGPRVASSGPRAVGPRMAIASTSAPRPAPAGSADRNDAAGDPSAEETPPEGSPDGNTPRGRPRLTRIK